MEMVNKVSFRAYTNKKIEIPLIFYVVRFKMSKELFSQSDIDSGLNSIILSYFDRMYEDGDFLEMLQLLSQKGALSTDGAYCHFPDINSYDDEDHFEGVQFAVGYPPEEEDTVIVSEETCYYYVRLACARYLKLHPEDTVKVNQLLAKIPVSV